MEFEAAWWIAALAAPVVVALCWMICNMRRDLRGHGGQRHIDIATVTHDDLAAFKLEVARTYVPLSLIRDMDRRLSQHLLRIEGKIEAMRPAIAHARECSDPGT